ncbi:uncharacterized protein LOC118609302 [Rousettus aegyptiacus]|uniref:uncharacterized protein LOC118609302 n=1 Tax=Rousettus aegyptiacus TaxID=9407 RepID=UPI00168D7050|nr:uncharacterized protein LOC118609302 [Rousettus aegyptiacus]
MALILPLPVSLSLAKISIEGKARVIKTEVSHENGVRSPQPTRTAACLLPGLPLQQSRRQRGGDAQGRQDRGRPTLESAWGRQARGEFAAQVNRLARRRALPPPRPPSDFQARNSASRALSLARSLSRSLAASAAAAASLHTKDCYPLSSSSTSTSSSCDSSPDSRAGARRRRRREDLSLPATEAVSVAFFFLFYFALLLLLLLFCPYTSSAFLRFHPPLPSLLPPPPINNSPTTTPPNK